MLNHTAPTLSDLIKISATVCSPYARREAFAIAKPPTRHRNGNESGPFEGVELYNEGCVMFGPDDPERRFLYTGRVDTWSLFRLDLEKRHIWALAPADGKKRYNPGFEGQPVRWIDKGPSAGPVPIYGGGCWSEGSDLISRVHSPALVWRLKRVK